MFLHDFSYLHINYYTILFVREAYCTYILRIILYAFSNNEFIKKMKCATQNIKRFFKSYNMNKYNSIKVYQTNTHKNVRQHQQIKELQDAKNINKQKFNRVNKHKINRLLMMEVYKLLTLTK